MMQRNRYFQLMVASIFVLVAHASLFAQGRGGAGQRQQAPPTPKAAAPFDITGYWTAVVAEDWRYRMVLPRKGDYDGLPLNDAGRKLADTWDPAKDEASGQQCRSYGAPGLMRLPGHLHITWQDDQTLKIEADAGTQTRTLYFGTPQGKGGDWQGVSKAEWEFVPLGGFARRGFPNSPGGSLKITTTQLKPGYLRKNGVPYGANATTTEYLDRIDVDGQTFLVEILTVIDPEYLTGEYSTSFHFRKMPDGSLWKPTPCESR